MALCVDHDTSTLRLSKWGGMLCYYTNRPFCCRYVHKTPGLCIALSPFQSCSVLHPIGTDHQHVDPQIYQTSHQISVETLDLKKKKTTQAMSSREKQRESYAVDCRYLHTCYESVYSYRRSLSSEEIISSYLSLLTSTRGGNDDLLTLLLIINV